MNNEDDSAIIKDLSEDLNKKSIEELIYINFNPRITLHSSQRMEESEWETAQWSEGT